MDAPRYDRHRERRVWFSPVLLAVALFPALMQAQCVRTGDTTLTVLEFEAGGANQVQFSSSHPLRKPTLLAQLIRVAHASVRG